jgi:hypothetical protein
MNKENMKLNNSVYDDDYINKITPKVENSASKTDMESWAKEFSYSVKNYKVAEYLDFGEDRAKVQNCPWLRPKGVWWIDGIF